MFSHNLAEKQTGRVEIGDLSSAAIRSVLAILYTGYLNPYPTNDYKHLLEVARFADKYAMKEVVSACANDLYLETNLLNVVDILVHVNDANFDEFKGLREKLIGYVAT
jgi:hypothetical protein